MKGSIKGKKRMKSKGFDTKKRENKMNLRGSKQGHKNQEERSP